MKIVFFTLFRGVGSSHVRVLQFLPYLEKRGVHCTVKSLYSDEFYRIQMGSPTQRFFPRKFYIRAWYALGIIRRFSHIFTVGEYDIVFIQKDTLPVIFLAVVRFLNRNIIYEFDDNISVPNPHLKKGVVMTLLLLYRAFLFKRACRMASHIIAENSYLKTIAEKYNPNVSVITAPVDIQKYRPSKPSRKGKEVILGWLGSPSTLYLLFPLETVFCRIGKKYTNVTILLTGAARLRNHFSGANVVYHEWSEETQLRDLRQYDIGLMPLDDQEFNKGRLGYKMILYMASGIPVVASDVGLNREVVKKGQNGFLVSSEDEWLDRLSFLIENGNERKRMGEIGRRMACEQYDLEKLGEELVKIFSEVAE